MKYKFTSLNISRTSPLSVAVDETFIPLMKTMTENGKEWTNFLAIDFMWMIRGGRRRDDTSLRISLDDINAREVARIMGSACATMDILGVSGSPVRVRVAQVLDNPEDKMYSGRGKTRIHGDKIVLVAGEDSMLRTKDEVKGLGRCLVARYNDAPSKKLSYHRIERNKHNKDIREAALDVCRIFWSSYKETYRKIRSDQSSADFAKQAKERPDEIISFILDSSLEIINT